MGIVGVNSQGNTQKGFVVPEELWNSVAARAQKEGLAVADVLRTGMIMYLDGKLTVTEPWQQGRKKGSTSQTSAVPAIVKKTPAKAPAKSAPVKKTAAADKRPPTKTTSARHLRSVETASSVAEPQTPATVPAG